MNINETVLIRETRLKVRAIKSSQLSCQFVSSYFTLDSLPRDRFPHIAFAGRSNVGKSSLLNKLVGRKKMAKVSSTPGKTRSINLFKINERFYFADLPGYGYAKVSRSMRQEWGKLIEGYLTGHKHLIGLVLLLDCRRDFSEQDSQLVEWLAVRKLPVIIALTKSDKLTKDKLNRKVKELQNQLNVEIIPFSIVSGVGKNDILNSIHALLTDYEK